MNIFEEFIEDILDLYRYKGNKWYTVIKFTAIAIGTGLFALIISRVFSEDGPLKWALLVLTLIYGLENLVLAMYSHRNNKRFIQAKDDRDAALYESSRRHHRR